MRLLKQYVFIFYTDHPKGSMWEETIHAAGMMEAFLKAKKLLAAYEKEKQASVRVQYKGVRYHSIDIA
ncbi:hypothetical protein [Anoxybacillus sp. B7M1]|uniref:hypothetical protein n=1 Tax=Anoxybacillus sp. B7M1 TaxID=1490057 RepID=UPI003518B9B4